MRIIWLNIQIEQLSYSILIKKCQSDVQVDSLVKSAVNDIELLFF